MLEFFEKNWKVLVFIIGVASFVVYSVRKESAEEEKKDQENNKKKKAEESQKDKK